MRKSILLILVLLSVARSQEASETPVDGLKHGLALFSEGRYQEASAKFKHLAELYPSDEHQSIFRFLAAKSLYQGGDLRSARLEFERFLNDFPASSYRAAVYLFLGHIDYRGDDFPRSAENYLLSSEAQPRSKAAEIAAQNLTPMLKDELSIDQLNGLANKYPRARLVGEVTFYLGKRYYDGGMYTKAFRTLEKYLQRYSSGRHSGQAKELYARAAQMATSKAVVGVIAPLTGSYADYGQSIIKGVQIAFESLSVAGKQVELRIVDTQGSAVQATKAVKSLAAEEPVAIIGPLRSESAVGAAAVAEYNQVPLITPTASEQGIADLGEYIYQISPSAEQIAAALAEYAVMELGVRDFGVIAPGDFTGRQVSRAFAQRVYDLGGEVLSTAYYEPDQTDFSSQIKPLREVLLMRTEEQLASGILDSAQYFDFQKKEWLDQEEWRVYLGGLFLPGYPDELALLVPQIRYHIISTRYFGLDGWDSKELIAKIEPYVDGSIFATDYHPGSQGQPWDRFYIKYTEKFKSDPTRVAALAYDAASMVKLALENGARDAQEVNEYLKSLENYQGASCVINFKTSGNANDAASIFKINNITVAKVK